MDTAIAVAAAAVSLAALVFSYYRWRRDTGSVELVLEEGPRGLDLTVNSHTSRTITVHSLLLRLERTDQLLDRLRNHIGWWVLKNLRTRRLSPSRLMSEDRRDRLAGYALAMGGTVLDPDSSGLEGPGLPAELKPFAQLGWYQPYGSAKYPTATGRWLRIREHMDNRWRLRVSATAQLSGHPHRRIRSNSLAADTLAPNQPD